MSQEHPFASISSRVHLKAAVQKASAGHLGPAPIMLRKSLPRPMNAIYISLGALLILTSLANVFVKYQIRRDHKALDAYSKSSS